MKTRGGVCACASNGRLANNNSTILFIALLIYGFNVLFDCFIVFCLNFYLPLQYSAKSCVMRAKVGRVSLLPEALGRGISPFGFGLPDGTYPRMCLSFFSPRSAAGTDLSGALSDVFHGCKVLYEWLVVVNYAIVISSVLLHHQFLCPRGRGGDEGHEVGAGGEFGEVN